ncbi:MAG: hypothetical protein KAX18_14095, partial [Candidatus Lokiarchaeota archaeon]|nr:hypothetical protein [Candidatus Lokiarchaeota archaeon]
YHIIFYLIFKHLLFMIRDSSIEDSARDIAKYEENITKILDRAVKLFKRTDLTELADKWDKILNSYRSKKKSN